VRIFWNVAVSSALTELITFGELLDHAEKAMTDLDQD